MYTVPIQSCTVCIHLQVHDCIYLTDVIGEGHIEPLCVVAVELVGLGEHGDDGEHQVLSHVVASLRENQYQNTKN